jgi:primosomal protein N' (replication factor Y)
VLALVPEIALTPQFVGRFRARFGEEVSVLHSARTEGERLAEWRRIRRGEARIVIGARSAVFAPIDRLGLVVVDEEHDGSYKQEDGLRYNGRELARFRAERDGAVLLLGSATPSLETFESARTDELGLLSLTERPGGGSLPGVELVDLRKQVDRGGTQGVFSEELREALARTLGDGHQAILFLNRRGFAPAVLCPACGESVRCGHCSVALTLHDRDGILLCHYCGRSRPRTLPCGGCGRKDLLPLGVGTERVERELHWLFPDARIARMDRDAVRRKGEHERILARLARGQTDILIGTQMVTKGLDLPNVTLVGVLLADQALHLPDFRSAERTFQLLTQVVGRSGRGARSGRAIVQTFQPDHYAVAAAARQDFDAFFGREITFRRELRYPPFSSLALLQFSGRDKETVRKAALWAGLQARKHNRNAEVDFLGPAPAPVAKVADETRHHLIVRSPRGPAAAAFARWLSETAREPLAARGVKLTLDVDPYRFL